MGVGAGVRWSATSRGTVHRPSPCGRAGPALHRRARDSSCRVRRDRRSGRAAGARVFRAAHCGGSAGSVLSRSPWCAAPSTRQDQQAARPQGAGLAGPGSRPPSPIAGCETRGWNRAPPATQSPSTITGFVYSVNGHTLFKSPCKEVRPGRGSIPRVTATGSCGAILPETVRAGMQHPIPRSCIPVCPGIPLPGHTGHPGHRLMALAEIGSGALSVKAKACR